MTKRFEGCRQTTVRRGGFTAALAAISVAAACSSPTPQSGTNTNWVKHCASDSDCSTGACKCGVCTRECSSSSDCSSLDGAKCISPSEVSDGCELHSSICLLECTKDADCSALGSHAVCGKNVCTVPSCLGSSAPDCHAGGAPVCGADWNEAQSLFASCWTGNKDDSFLANCGPYRAVATFGTDGYSAYFYDSSGKLVGRGSKSNIGVGCDAYDPSFVFPAETCTPIAECGPDASTPPLDGGTPDGSGGDSGRHPTSGDLSAITATDTGWVAVGNSGGGPLVMTSETGLDWTVADVPGEAGSLTDVAFGSGTVVALGQNTSVGQIVTKPAGGAWQTQPVSLYTLKVEYASGTFLVSAGVEPGARVSNDGVHWTSLANTADGPCCLVGAVQGKFVALGSWPTADAGAVGSSLRTSLDGVVWANPIPMVPPIGVMTDLAETGNQIFGIGVTVCLTPFGPDGGDGGCVPPAGEVVLHSASSSAPLSELLYSPAPWGSAPGMEGPNKIAASDRRVIALSQWRFYGAALPLGSGNWDLGTRDTAFSWSDISYAHGRFVVVGSHFGAPIVMTSTDGLSWQTVYE
jgi:hypothetical protein